MRPLNYPFLGRYIPTRRYRTGILLSGPIDGVNTTFTAPPGDKFVHDPPYIQIGVYYNGMRLLWLDDYLLVESGGGGTGYDTVVLAIAPKPGDKVFADYVTIQ